MKKAFVSLIVLMALVFLIVGPGRATDVKITDLDALTAPVAADVCLIVDDVAGTATTKKITYSYLVLNPTDAVSITDTGTAAANLDILSVTNLGNAASMTGTETSMAFNQYYYDAATPATADSGRITIGTEGNWTSTASTQDSYMAFETCLNGTVTEYARILSSGDVGFGTTAATALLDLEDTGTATSNVDVLEITNKANASSMTATETSILFNQWYYDAATPAVADIGRISYGTEGNWTSTASTQDGYLALETALNGTVTEYERILSSGYHGFGTTAPGTYIDIEKAGTATATTDFIELTNSGNAASMTNTGTGILINQFYYDAATPAVADAGRVSVTTEGNWTSTASTQDATMHFATALNGTVTDQMTLSSAGLLTSTGGVTIGTGKHLTLGSTQWDDGSDAIDGEQIAADTIDDDSIDFSDVTGADLTLTDCGAITIGTGLHFTVGTTQWDDGSDAIDGEKIAADTIDDDSIDFADVTGADLTLTDCGAITIGTGLHFTVGTTQWDDGSDAIDGEQIAADTIDDDSIDFSDVTGADLDLMDATYINSSKYYWVEEFDDEENAVQFESGLRADFYVTAGTNYAAANVTYTMGVGGTLGAVTAGADDDSVTILGAGNFNTTQNPIVEARFKIADISNAYLAVGFAEGSYADKAAHDDDIAVVILDSDNTHTLGATSLVLATNDNNGGVIYKDTGASIANGTYVTIKIDLTDTEDVRVWVNGTEADISGATVQDTAVMRPYIMVQSLSVAADTLTVDYVKCWQDRG